MTVIKLLKVNLDKQWVQAAGHSLSQWSRDRVEIIYSMNAAEGESSRSPTNVCSTPCPPPPISQLLLLGRRTKIPRESRHFRPGKVGRYSGYRLQATRAGGWQRPGGSGTRLQATTLLIQAFLRKEGGLHSLVSSHVPGRTTLHQIRTCFPSLEQNNHG